MRPHQAGRRRGERTAVACGGGGLDPASLVDTGLHRFPWPANPEQRYGLASPWLAVVNARGPFGVWRHDRTGPKWLPWCRSLWSKDLWRESGDGFKVFCWRIWQWAADEDLWGIVWGDPVRLCRQWELDPATFSAWLETMLQAGWLVYLTDAERDAARAWREGEKPRGGKGGNLEKRERGTGTATGTATGTDDSGQQVTDPYSARAIQVSDSATGTGTGTGTATGKVTARAQSSHSTQPQPAESASLPKSDHGAASGRSKPVGPAKGLAGKSSRRPPSVPRDAKRVGELIHWSDPQAVAFGRAMYEAIHGHAAPPDIQAAHDEDKSIVGVWAKYWIDHRIGSLPADRQREFVARCCTDVGKKRKVRSIRNLGALARKTIVPGVLVAVRGTT
jgi:hypothetical protein